MSGDEKTKSVKQADKTQDQYESRLLAYRMNNKSRERVLREDGVYLEQKRETAQFCPVTRLKLLRRKSVG